MTKLRFKDRILSAVMGLLCIAVAAALVLNAFDLLPVQQIKDFLGGLITAQWQKWVILGVGALILLLLGLHGVGMLFRRRKDKGFVVQHTEYGDMSISMKAMENMVKKCVDAHSELTVNHTKIYLVRNGVSVDMKITLASGVNIPLTVNALQKQIKQYITSCSGVDVHQVRVKVETDTVKLLPPPQAPVVEPAPVEEIKRVAPPAEPLHQHTEEPQHYTETSTVKEPELPACEPVAEEKTEEALVAGETVSEPEMAEEAIAEASEDDAAEKVEMEASAKTEEAQEDTPVVVEEANA